jgi:hypothetical protein
MKAGKSELRRTTRFGLGHTLDGQIARVQQNLFAVSQRLHRHVHVTEHNLRSAKVRTAERKEREGTKASNTLLPCA